MNNSLNGTWTPVKIDETAKDEHKKYWAHVNVALEEFQKIAADDLNLGWEISTRYDYGAIPEIVVTKKGAVTRETIKMDYIRNSAGGKWSSGYGFAGLQFKIWGYRGRYSNTFIRKVMMGKARTDMHGKCFEMVEEAKRRVEQDINEAIVLAARKEVKVEIFSMVPEKFKWDIEIPNEYSGSADKVSFRNLNAEQIKILIAKYIELKGEN